MRQLFTSDDGCWGEYFLWFAEHGLRFVVVLVMRISGIFFLQSNLCMANETGNGRCLYKSQVANIQAKAF